MSEYQDDLVRRIEELSDSQKRIHSTLKVLNFTIHGAGQDPGLKGRLMKVELAIGSYTKLFWLGAAGIVGLFGNMLLQFLTWKQV